jgi:hypothetical protein
MSEKRLEEQRLDKKHRKLIRSPEKLSPCDFDPPFNPSFLSTATNIFAVSHSNSRSSPTKHLHNDHHIAAPQHHQQVPLPPSSSVPAIALYRKPSITIKYTKDEEVSVGHQSPSSLAHHQQISKSIDSNHPFTRTISTKENADQMSNNFLINVNKCRVTSPSKPPPSSTFSFAEAYNQQQQQAPQIFSSSPTSQSLNLSLLQSDHNNITTGGGGGHIMFNSNNPFLNDTFDAITAHEDEGGGKINANFFNIDDSNESELLYEAENAAVVEEEQLLKNKREKFSNASTMKICLVVSPPTNKLFHVSEAPRPPKIHDSIKAFR